MCNYTGLKNRVKQYSKISSKSDEEVRVKGGGMMLYIVLVHFPNGFNL